MKNDNPERLIFADDLAKYRAAVSTDVLSPKPYVRDLRGWCLFGPTDVRGHQSRYQFMLQKLPSQKLPRVRVGCRYYTLREAWVHWGVQNRRNRYYTRRNECQQAVTIIRLMLLQAQAWGLLSLYAKPIKFDSTLIKPKRK